MSRDNSKSPEMDTDSRNRIVSDINTNLFVEASAGSGKTTMLVTRMAAMIENGIDISTISAITFTKAAANEFYDRFQKLLIERSNPDYVWTDRGMAGQLPPPTEVTRKRCREALQNIDLCFMGTIDAFCKMVLSEHPYEAGIPSDAEIVSDQEASALYRQEYVKICDGVYGKDIASLARRFHAVHGDAEKVFLTGASILMENRNVHFNFDEAEAFDIDKEFASDRKDVIRAVKCLADHPEIKYLDNTANLKAWENIEKVYRSIRNRWSYNFSSVLYDLEKNLKDIRVIPQAMDEYPSEIGKIFIPGGKSGKWLELSSAFKDELLGRMQNIQYNVSMTFLSRCIPILETALRNQGKMTFFDCLYYLRNMLKKDAEDDGRLIRYIQKRHRYFLIDEFQDTNPMQAEVFFYLTAENPVPRWTECVPMPGTLFIVGDPKQSIYRFRGADVASFLNVKKIFEKKGGAILHLSRNFRSTPMLCEHFNRVFTTMLPEETENQSKFEEIPLHEDMSDGFQGVFTYRSYSGTKAESEHPKETDSIRIADIIETLVNHENYQIGAGEKKRNIRFSDIMVITSGKKKLGYIMEELHKREIPLKVEGEVPFAKNKALCEVYKIYASVADLNDQIALYGALTGEVFNFSLEDMLMYKRFSLNASSQKEVKSPPNETVQPIVAAIDKLRELSDKAFRLSPAALFDKIVNDFRIYEIMEAEELEILYYTMELLRKAEKSGQVISLKDGSKYIQELIRAKSGEERCLSLDDTKDCVHMANLHKVKGLEAPVVILAAATDRSFRPKKGIRHGDTSSEGYIFSLESDKNENGSSWSYFKTSRFSAEAETEKAAGEAEKDRLVYVAGTRARNALIIWDDNKSKWKKLISGNLPDFFEQADCESERGKVIGKSVNATELYEKAARESALNHRSVEDSTYTVKTPSQLPLSSKLEEDFGEAMETMPETSSSESQHFPALLGTMVHRLMEVLVSTKNQVDVDMAIREIISEYRTPTAEPFEMELSTVLSHVAEKIRDGGYAQTNGLPQDILGTLLRADEVYCEVPFCFKEETTGVPVIWNGVMDVVYLLDGQWHIVDYKTSADGKDLDVKYQAQLEAYRKAFKATAGYEADAFTYHIASAIISHG